MICGSRCLPHVPPRVLPKFESGSLSPVTDLDVHGRESGRIFRAIAHRSASTAAVVLVN
jgi:hypothetical protein